MKRKHERLLQLDRCMAHERMDVLGKPNDLRPVSVIEPPKRWRGLAAMSPRSTAHVSIPGITDKRWSPARLMAVVADFVVRAELRMLAFRADPASKYPVSP